MTKIVFSKRELRILIDALAEYWTGEDDASLSLLERLEAIERLDRRS